VVAPTSRRSALRALLGGASVALLTGCDRLSQSTWFSKTLRGGETMSRSVQKLLTSRSSLAQEFSEQDVSPDFRSNGTSMPPGEHYEALAAGNFADWRLQVDGLVEKPQAFSLPALRAMPSRTQITRHDCVEGWSAIGKWKGVQLVHVLEKVQPKPNARYVVFHCADSMNDDGTFYYESIDLEDANHPQTILAYELNDMILPIKNGAPLRLRVERQLGYKHAKYLMRLELVSSFAHLGQGNGGYWEDGGYEWYAGI
jgi:DMSO/TMAO reductase YedYZ molybdopterin-dependent catalytic subunit